MLHIHYIPLIKYLQIKVLPSDRSVTFLVILLRFFCNDVLRCLQKLERELSCALSPIIRKTDSSYSCAHEIYNTCGAQATSCPVLFHRWQWPFSHRRASKITYRTWGASYLVEVLPDVTDQALPGLTRSALVLIGVLLWSIRRSLTHVSRIDLSRAMMSLPFPFAAVVLVVLLGSVVLRMVNA